MPRILLVKTSSLGDVVHNLPVASDIAVALPGAQIDWIVEHDFAAIPALHPSVSRVIPVALRRWRKQWWRGDTRREMHAFFSALREVRYDAVLDTQSLLKSALVTWAAKGPRYGLDWRSSREPLAIFYDRTFRVAWKRQAVERNRALAGQALRYTPNGHVQYGISTVATRSPSIRADRYAFLIHVTSARRKLWPEERWVAVGQALSDAGVISVLPWGSALEHERSVRLSRSIKGSVVPAAMDLSELAANLQQAHCAIGVDTGLTHLAGALSVATVGIYTSTDPQRTGLYGCARAINVGGPHRSPDVQEVLRALESLTR
ncbi:MAG: lipopolysaccharide heptosyltransferase I [Burkholderiales bacterium]